MATMKHCNICKGIKIRDVFCDIKTCDIFDRFTGVSLFCDPGHLNYFGTSRFISRVMNEIE